MIHCLHCGAETSNGLALCELSQRKAESCLDVLPIYFRNLARWRPGRAGSRPVPGSRALYDGSVTTGTGDRISDSVDETFTMLTTRARELVEARTLPRPLTLTDAVLSDDLAGEFADALNDDQPRAAELLCQGIKRRLASIATTDWCGDLVRDLSEHEDVLRALTEHAVPGWYAGGCRHCSAPTYVVPGLTWVACRSCGATTAARDHLEVVLSEAGGWVAPPMRIAEAIVALVDTEISTVRLYERVKKWGQRGRITSVRRLDADGDEVGPAKYRLGEVLEVLFAEGATRLDEPLAPVSVTAS